VAGAILRNNLTKGNAMSKQAIRNRRLKVELDYVKPRTKEKFIQDVLEVDVQEQAPVPRLEAKNQNQKTALAMFREGLPVIFLAGSAGVGKSMLAAWHAASQLKAKKVDKIFLVRPAVPVGKSIGMLPGTIQEKLLPYFAQTLDHLSKFLGHGYLKYCLEKEVIEMKPSEYLRGMSFERCIVIAEESQDYTADEFEMILTRMGDSSTLIFTGDEKQHDLRGISGLETTLEMIDRMLDNEPSYLQDEDLDNLANKVGIVRFTPDDVVRSGLTRTFVRMYYNN
jgi:phosphate starvation-inducible PhoH-like protein